MKNLKFAILGCGYIAGKMAEAVKVLESKCMGVELYAAAARDLAKAEAFAGEYGAQVAYGSYEELVADSKVDLIYIATPHSHHYEHAKLCINAGRNVLIEKAFCGNVKQATEVIALAHDKGVFLSEAMWSRFLPAVDVVRGWIKAGRIGEVQSVEADFSQPLTHVERLMNPALAGGALLDLGIYSLTFADLFLNEEGCQGNDGIVGRDCANYGAPIANIDARCIKTDTGVDATDWINITYKNGKKAYLKCSIANPWHNEGIIYGTKGYIRVVNLNDMEELQVYDAADALVESVKPERICNCYEYEVLACRDALAKGDKECPEMTHYKTMEMMELMDSIRDRFGVSYPFEIAPGVTWDRSGNKSVLQVFDIASGKITTLKKFDCVIEAPNWSIDGTHLTYNSNGRIFKMDLERNAAGELTAGDITEVPSYYVDNCNNDHVLDPDGSGLYVSHHTKEDGLSRIYKIFFDGREPVLVTPLAPSYLHGITPDGKMLAYCAERNGEYDIYTIPTAGGNETQLTVARGLNDGPEYDCKGEYIYFNSVRTGRMQAWRMKADGSEQEQLTFDEHWNTWFPHISPDLKKVVMVAYTEVDVKPGEHVPNKMVELRLMEKEILPLRGPATLRNKFLSVLQPAQGRDNMSNGRDGKWSAPKTILKLFGGQGTINVNSWAPDSNQFAFVIYEK
ncbi:MAG: Gfo/Idh/MocA family oxidoreductase [Fibrobacter sp.]|nr:Gfo/Idh/MocA family oxidoreductase [Fibrobacter sp.]